MSGITRRTTFGAAFSVTLGTLAACSSNSTRTPQPVSFHLKIASGSMELTLTQGQTVTVEAVIPGKYRPRRQDIVFFHPPTAWNGLTTSELLVSRMIGIPGDEVSCAGRGAPMMLNGAVLK